MRIAYLCADFGVPVFGHVGNAIHVREMVEAFRRAGHEVWLMSPRLEDAASAADGNRFRPGGPPLHLLPVPAEPHHRALFAELETLDELIGMRTRVRQELRNLLYNLTLRGGARDALREAGVDFVYERYTFASHAGVLVARELGIPHLLEVNAPLSLEQERRAGVEMKALACELEQRTWLGTDRLLPVSEALRSFAREGGVPDERIYVVPNAVDMERFDAAHAARDATRRRLGIGDRCCIGFLGSLKSWHGTELLLEAFVRLRARRGGLHLLIVGDGPRGKALHAEVAARGLEAEVTLTGALPHDEAARCVAAMDVAAAPYLPDERFYFSPIKLFEYLALGCPVVASDVGQISEILAGGELGCLVPPGDVEALTDALEGLADHPQQRTALGARGRAHVAAHHTWDRNAARVLELVRTLRR